MDAQSPGPGGGRLGDVERLVSGMGGFLAQLAKRLRQGATVVAGLAAAVGVVALALGVWAWHDSAGVLVFVALVCVPAILAPVFVLRRSRALTDAVAHPDETARQAREYFGGLQSTPELDKLVKEAAGLQRSGGRARVLGAFRSARLVGSLVGSIAPDPRTQPLVAAFQPGRLRTIWLSVIASWWLAVVASMIAIVAVVSIIADNLA